MDKMTNQDLKRGVATHAVMTIVWEIVAITILLNSDRITWVVGFIAVIYLALDELVNAFFYWRQYHGRISEVQEGVDAPAAKKE